MIHAALIVFLIEGTGATFTPPARFHRRTLLRVAFASVNFAVLLLALLVPYTWGAARMHAEVTRAELTRAGATGDVPTTHSAPHDSGAAVSRP